MLLLSLLAGLSCRVERQSASAFLPLIFPVIFLSPIRHSFLHPGKIFSYSLRLFSDATSGEIEPPE